MNPINNEYVLRKAKITGTDQVSQNAQSVKNAQPAKSFQEVFGEIQSKQSLKFSKHALQRLKSRNIELQESDIQKLKEAVEKADSKGVKEALILMGDKAFIASVKNRTIITASTDEQLKENVFTNIDGAVII